MVGGRDEGKDGVCFVDGAFFSVHDERRDGVCLSVIDRAGFWLRGHLA
jgi:hypothetical protein